jgi:hypothetical protein
MVLRSGERARVALRARARVTAPRRWHLCADMTLRSDLPGRCRDEEAGSEAETRKFARHRTRDERLRQRESRRDLCANEGEGASARRGDDQAVRWNVDRNAGMSAGRPRSHPRGRSEKRALPAPAREPRSRQGRRLRRRLQERTSLVFASTSAFLCRSLIQLVNLE